MSSNRKIKMIVIDLFLEGFDEIKHWHIERDDDGSDNASNNHHRDWLHCFGES